MADENRVIIRVTSENDTRAGFDAAKADAARAGDEAGQSYHQSFTARLGAAMFGGLFGGGGGGGGAAAGAAGGGGGLAALGPYGIGAGIAAGALTAPAAAGGIATLGLGAIGIKDAFAQNTAAATAFSDALKPISEIAGKAFQPVIEFMTEMAKQLAGPVGQMIADAEPGMLSFFKNLEPYLAKIVPEVGQFVRAFAPFAGEMGTTLGIALQAIVRGLQNLEPGFLASAHFIHGFVATVAALFDGLTRLVGDLVAVIGDIFRGKWGDIWTRAKDILHYSMDGLAAILQKFVNWSLTTWVPSVLSAIGHGLAKLPGVLEEIGKNAISAFLAGLQSVPVLGTVEKIAGGLVDGLKHFLGIHSPSAVLQEIGANAREGFRLGLAGTGNLSLGGAITGGVGAASGGSGGWVEARLQIAPSGSAAFDAFAQGFKLWIRTHGGGNRPDGVQRALGQV